MNRDIGISHKARSIPEVVEQLVHEFDGRLAVRAVTEVVMRLSRNGAVSLPVLTDMARNELTVLAVTNGGQHPPRR